MPVKRLALLAPVLLLSLLTGCGGDGVRPQELRNAVALGDDDTAFVILEHNPEMAGAADTCGDTPLHFAAARGNAPLVEHLLALGADARAGDLLGFTPLHWAARAGNLSAVRQLLAAHADPAAVSQDAWTPLHDAVLAKGSLAPVEDRIAIVKLLIDAKGNCNARAGRWQVTPLHVAVTRGNAALVAALLAAGADPTIKDADEKTPLDEARANNLTDIVKLLEAPRGHP